MENTSLEQTLQEGKLFRHINSLIVSHLRGQNLTQAAIAVASATMTPLTTEAPANRLLELVAKVLLNPLINTCIYAFSSHYRDNYEDADRCMWFKVVYSCKIAHFISSNLRWKQGIAAENNDLDRGSLSSSLIESFAPLANGANPPSRTTTVDFSAPFDKNGSSKSFPKHESRHLLEHKNVVRCAKFSPDGKYVATSSADLSIKLFEVAKVKPMMLQASHSKDSSVRPVMWTFCDHTQPVNDLDFHRQHMILISGANDNTIRFFDFSKANARRAFKIIQDTHSVYSVSFHPSGEFVLAGTDHQIPHLYDVNTYQCYLPANTNNIDQKGAINQVRYSSTGGMYVSASRDGAVRLWDGVTAKCVRSINGAHGRAEATSVMFTKDQRFILSSGKDSSAKLWEIGTGRLVKEYVGAAHTQFRCQAVFNDTEEFVLAVDETNNEIIIWDSLTSEKVARWPSNHSNAPRWIDHSPTEPAFVTCGTDRVVRFWKEAA